MTYNSWVYVAEADPNFYSGKDCQLASIPQIYLEIVLFDQMMLIHTGLTS